MKECSKCNNKHYAKGFCETHYKKFREVSRVNVKKCDKDNCDGNHYAKGLCRKHYKTKIKKEWRDNIKNTPEYKIEKNLRNRHNQAFKNKKLSHPIKNLGCTLGELKKHLESLFKPGMTWDNRGLGPGKWQVDHIIPFSAVDIFNEADQLKVCHYTNLQPIWFEEHSIKSSKERWSK